MTGGGRYAVPAATHRVEHVIERSRFICTMARAADPSEAHAFIKAVSAEFADATHNCWAFVAGPPGTSTHIGLSDDGEPHGTAGRPMLTVLMHSEVGEIAAVVTRYFGGVKLGTGGLARAYASSVQLALASLVRAERVDWVELVVVIAYTHVGAVQLLLPVQGGEVLHEEYGADVTLRVRVPAPAEQQLRAALGDATRGQAVVRAV
jgi:uncharacterized YigZ family protein